MVISPGDKTMAEPPVLYDNREWYSKNFFSAGAAVRIAAVGAVIAITVRSNPPRCLPPIKKPFSAEFQVQHRKPELCGRGQRWRICGS